MKIKQDFKSTILLFPLSLNEAYVESYGGLTVPKSSRWQMIYKIGVFLEFRKIHIKAPVLESLSNKVAGSRPTTLLKRDSRTNVFR